MALAMSTTAGFCGSSHAVLAGSLQLSSSSSRLSMPKTNRLAFTKSGLKVRAQQQGSAETAETSRRAMLGLLAAGMASGSFVQTVLAESNSTLLVTPTALSGTRTTKTIRVAGIPGLLSVKSDSQGLIRAATQLSIDGLVVDPIDITKLPLINVEDDPNFPSEVQAFMDQILLADAILFSAPEYNYSVTPITKNAIDWLSLMPQTLAGKAAAIISTGWDFGGGRMQYHLRQIGVRPDLHFINKPEVFVSTIVDAQHPPKFDANGDLIDDNVRAQLQQLLISLRDFTLQLQCTNATSQAKAILT
ncbi:NADPH:quinone oxidoreductase-like [Sesamum indicum]|uniref:NAD(P)H dehydrogenase (quinone) n=1 Tax=Sesamum indicum TaxID=4182 RepID=A0A6I9TL45_SESIN|nr:NADPH:quinone oxidoreductase-like [Sesamum indicum]